MLKIPDDCPESHGEDCPVADEIVTRHEKRRRSDRMSASATRIILALIGVIGAGSGGYLVRDRVVAAAPPATPAAVDMEARTEIRLLRTEIGGDLKLINQQLAQILEAQRESKEERERLIRRIERLPR